MVRWMLGFVVAFLASPAASFQSVAFRPSKVVLSASVAAPWTDAVPMPDADFTNESVAKSPETPVENHAVTMNVAPQRPRKLPVVLPPRDEVKAERTLRALLETRLAMKTTTAAESPVMAVAVKSDAERFQRSLLATRFMLEERKSNTAKSATLELRQRALLAARLDLQKKAISTGGEMQADDARRVESPQDEAQLAAKYAAIEDIGDRAFAILKDLGFGKDMEH